MTNPSVLIVGAALLAGCGVTTIPARIDSVNGQQVEVATAGSGGNATVVFEAGLGNDWTPWDQVASEVAQHTRIFAYSREGYGASGPLMTSRDPQQIVEQLRSLLVFEGYAPPYVLVGHSNGGGYMELFAKAHADEVSGVVLVDPRHRDFLSECEAAELDMCGIAESLLLEQAPSVIAEYHAYAMMADEARTAGAFGSYPVRVLTSTVDNGSPARQELWQSLHASLAAEASDGEQIIVEGATHNIEVERPHLVAQTILSVLP